MRIAAGLTSGRIWISDSCLSDFSSWPSFAFPFGPIAQTGQSTRLRFAYLLQRLTLLVNVFGKRGSTVWKGKGQG